MMTLEERIKEAAKLMASKSIEFRRLGIKKSIKIINSPKISYNGLLLIVKGLYIALWQQDKLLLQESIVNKFIRILNKIKSKTTKQKYICAIFETLVREWDKLDKWRVDKYLALTRKIFVKGLAKACVDGTLVDFINDLFDKVLNKDPLEATDLKLFMLRVVQEELASAIFSSHVVHSFIERIFQLIMQLSRGHQYTDQVLNLTRNLIRLLRPKGFSSNKFILLSESTMKLSTESTKFKKFFTGISKLSFSFSKDADPEPEAECQELQQEPDTPPESTPSQKKKKINEVSPQKRKEACQSEIEPELPKLKSRRISLNQINVEASPKPSVINNSLMSMDDSFGDDPMCEANKSRVSFGKIYRKRFSSKKRLSLPNIPSNIPAPKSILKKRP